MQIIFDRLMETWAAWTAHSRLTGQSVLLGPLQDKTWTAILQRRERLCDRPQATRERSLHLEFITALCGRLVEKTRHARVYKPTPSVYKPILSVYKPTFSVYKFTFSVYTPTLFSLQANGRGVSPAAS